MAHANSQIGADELPAIPRPEFSSDPPRILIIGAGSRGDAYARAVGESTNGILVGVAEPINSKRKKLGEAHIWGNEGPGDGQEFRTWQEFVNWESTRREKAEKGEDVPKGYDAVFICVQDKMHREVIHGIQPLGVHIMCEKPLSVSLDDCVSIYKELAPKPASRTIPSRIFSIGHVLRYSPHNMLLRKLLLEDRVVGDIMSINHTEPVGWWHFTHSYVRYVFMHVLFSMLTRSRGNWRREDMSAPTLLTKSCHDIDLLLWLLCSPPPGSTDVAHIPTTVSSSGSLNYFNKSRKPASAGQATNCLSCPIEDSCKYSSKKIYLGSQHKGLATKNLDWPIDIVVPDIEECITAGGQVAGEKAIMAKLEEDYTTKTDDNEIKKRNWFGRCVYESDNDVCDDQIVTMTWDNDLLPTSTPSDASPLCGRGAKTAVFHMIAHTKKICQRYSHIYGVDGEIYADSKTITVEDFNTGQTKVYKPHMAGGGHGGGDDGLARQFVLAVDRVKNHGMNVEEAQKMYVGCTLEEVMRSHAMVFCADEARKEKKVVEFPKWWAENVEAVLNNEKGTIGEKVNGV